MSKDEIYLLAIENLKERLKEAYDVIEQQGKELINLKYEYYTSNLDKIIDKNIKHEEKYKPTCAWNDF
jgi:hypothetical protein